MPTLLIWEDDSGQTQAVRFDVVFSENLDSTSEITDHPVEEGQAVTDHVRPAPERFSIVGFVSNHPLRRNPGVEDIVNFEPVELDYPEKPSAFASGNLTLGVTGAIEKLINPLPSKAHVWNVTDFKNRMREMYEQLFDAWENARIIRIETTLREYENMVIERLAASRTADDGSGATFPMDLRNIKRVKSKTVQAPVPAEPRGQLVQSKGSQAAQAAKNDEKKAEKAKSLAARLFDGGSDLLSNVSLP